MSSDDVFDHDDRLVRPLTNSERLQLQDEKEANMSSQEKSEWFEGRHTTDAPPPVPDIGDFIKQKLERADVEEGSFSPSFYDRMGQIFEHVSFIILTAYRLEEGKETNISFSVNLKFNIRCSGGTYSRRGADPEWRQFYVNDEWVGNAWGMSKSISAQCYEEFLGMLMRAFLKSI